MLFHFLDSLLIIVAFFGGFYLGRDRSLKLTEKVEVLKALIPERKGPVVVDVDEAEIERRDKKEEKEIIDVKDVIKELGKND